MINNTNKNPKQGHEDTCSDHAMRSQRPRTILTARETISKANSTDTLPEYVPCLMTKINWSWNIHVLTETRRCVRKYNSYVTQYKYTKKRFFLTFSLITAPQFRMSLV